MPYIKISLPFELTKLKNVIHVWLDLLKDEKYIEAFNLTMHDPYYEWTPALIEDCIKGYGLPYQEGETKYKVTEWKTAQSNNHQFNQNIELYEQPLFHSNINFKIIGIIYYDLPLNGKWSDLTATFQIIQADDYITLELNEIHVL